MGLANPLVLCHHVLMQITSFRDVIALLGHKSGDIADALGVKSDVVRKWKMRDSIPPEHWPEVIKVASYLGHEITVDALMALHQRRWSPIEGAGRACSAA